MPDPPEGVWWRHLAGVVVLALFVTPILFMLTGSLREAGLPPPRGLEFLPTPLAFDNYVRAFNLVAIPRQILNSAIVVTIAVPLTVLFASWAGFAMARLPRRSGGVLVGVSLVVLMVPITALLVSRFAMFRSVGLTDTYVPLIAPSLMGTSPFYVLIFYWSFRRLPQELLEASRLEGLGPFATWGQVAMPLVRPATVAVGMLAFVFTWSNFLDPLIYLYDPSTYTVPLGLRSLSTLGAQDFPLMLAGAVTATVPVILVFVFAQRYFLREFRGVGWLGR
jgi:multiple sugar transport system permease protein